MTPHDVLDFWTNQHGPEDWYKSDPALDEAIRSRFLPAWKQLDAGGLTEWIDGPEGALAYIILADQFPRNMFRDDPRSFATDPAARAAARRAIDEGWDLAIEEPTRQFFYLPFMHSEDMGDQKFCIAAVQERMPETGESTLLHARAHAHVIDTYGRFPHRNEALGRQTTADEEGYFDEGAYGGIVRKLQERDAD
ncbi:hypothetical protein CG51_16780 [Haematobacter missouriensis]|uniref:DUF924 domain-containing protein n=1 Tax=Haematobacter missouriensis TaxID=366616 RepID=A0A212AYA5_9RHOB|nr:DUF924 family protein [Haematobacter missouriensis]KFI33183.1 hypothetical protein CG51_16780 [Haematobacter missouriensis]OWJ78666.1 DUF924 domain-containing protein [Haematobacter missouriensis]OWJ86455.1 DUF924 domain-containing protein [Haematobacter missouriensis]